MTARQYSSVAPEMTLQSGISAVSTTLTVDTVAGLPGLYPYTVVIDPGIAGEEILTVTNVSSLTLTVTRGQDGSTATTHDAGAIVRHMGTARDLAEPQAHIYASTGVHGITGSVVGTTDTQTLSGKTISGTTNTLTNIPGANITGAASVPQSVLPATSVSTTGTQTLTNKTLTSPAITTPTGIVKGDVGLGNVDNTSDATKQAAAVTLTNKTMSGASNTFTNIPNSALSTGIDAGKIASVASSFVAKTALPTDTMYNTDTSFMTGTTNCGNAASGWTDGGCQIRVKNSAVQFDLVVTRTGGTITAGTSGNITDTIMFTITSNQTFNWPNKDIYGMGYKAGQQVAVKIDSSGNVIVYSSTPSVDIVNTDVIKGTFFWFGF